MVGDWLLRFEAADFDNAVFDMPVISAIRGASLAYLYSPSVVRSVFTRLGLASKEIYTGASQGAWLFEADASLAAVVEKAVAEALARPSEMGAPHQHLAYVTALVEGAGEEALARAEAICSLRKLQGEGFPLPAFAPEAKGYDEAGDRARPAVATIRVEAVSAAHRDRQAFGRRQRQAFYEDFSGTVPGSAFTDDFQAMVDVPPWPGGSSLPESLKNKVAVFYADGNRLGRHRVKATATGGLDGLRAFSDRLKANQRTLLHQTIMWLNAGAEGRDREAFLSEKEGSGGLRFETLMWGGDELLFVMPSWLGLAFAERFFEWTSDWKTAAGDPITFSAGMVICDRKTPIRQSRDVARRLAELCKSESMRGADGRSLLQIEVFESLSLPDGGIDAYRARLYRQSAASAELLNRQLAIPGECLADVVEQIAALKQGGGLPRSQLYRMLQIATDGAAGRLIGGRDIDEKLRQAWDVYRNRAGENNAPDRGKLEVLNFSPQYRLKDTPVPVFALHLGALAMLWDYVRPLDGAHER